ncbi:PREDICTED: uncharacterized protein LOC107124346, partial [Gekko japonicus]|uniref:Uncharacterized protein LOC107124346 n=1 Tax=Gekko japonicus TaxID=146911 RepID=A0ABM1LBE0_GEKJA
MKTGHESTIRLIKEERIAHIQSLEELAREDLAKLAVDLGKAHDSQVRTLKEEQAARIRSLEEQAREDRAQLQTSMGAGHESEIRILRDEQVARLNSLEERAREDLAQLRTVLGNGHESEIRILREEQTAHIKSLETRAREDVAKLQITLEKERSEHANRLDVQKAHYEGLLEQRRLESQEELSESQRIADDEIQQLRTDRVNLVMDKKALSDQVHETKLLCKAAQEKAAQAETALTTVTEELRKAQSTADYLLNRKREPTGEVSPTPSSKPALRKKEPDTPRDRGRISHTESPARHPDGSTEQDDLDLYRDPASQSEDDSDSTEPIPVNPVSVTNQTVTINNNRPRTKTVVENRPWRQEECKAVAEELGPLTEKNFVQWATTATTSYAGLEGEDLTMLARKCATGTALADINSAISSGNLVRATGEAWITQVITYLNPEYCLTEIFHNEKQGPYDDPEVYLARKQLLARVSGIVNGAVAPVNYNVPAFREALVKGLNQQAKQYLQLDDPQRGTWAELRNRIRRVSIAMRGAGALKPPKSHRKQIKDEDPSILEVTYANHGAQSSANASHDHSTGKAAQYNQAGRKPKGRTFGKGKAQAGQGPGRTQSSAENPTSQAPAYAPPPLPPPSYHQSQPMLHAQPPPQPHPVHHQQQHLA